MPEQTEEDVGVEIVSLVVQLASLTQVSVCSNSY